MPTPVQRRLSQREYSYANIYPYHRMTFPGKKSLLLACIYLLWATRVQSWGDRSKYLVHTQIRGSINNFNLKGSRYYLECMHKSNFGLKLLNKQLKVIKQSFYTINFYWAVGFGMRTKLTRNVCLCFFITHCDIFLRGLKSLQVYVL